MTYRIAVLGAGSWGTAIAVHLARVGHDVRDLVELLGGHRVAEFPVEASATRMRLARRIEADDLHVLVDDLQSAASHFHSRIGVPKWEGTPAAVEASVTRAIDRAQAALDAIASGYAVG